VINLRFQSESWSSGGANAAVAVGSAYSFDIIRLVSLEKDVNS